MGQNLMHWMMSAGSQFEESGPEARDRSHVGALREARIPSTVGRRSDSFEWLAGIIGLALVGRSRPIAARLTDCCALA